MTALVLAVALLAFVIVSDDVTIFRPAWLLHPFEQEHLTIAKHFADHGSLTIKDDWYGQSRGHGSEDKAYNDGALVPRSVLLPYLIYAVPFLFNDTAWLYVTPLFALAAATAAGVLVGRRTGSQLCGGVAGIALLTSSPILLNASGLAFENIIALAFLLWGVVTLERWAVIPTIRGALLVGIFFSLTALSRIDYGVAALVAGGYLVIRPWLERHEPRWLRSPVVWGAALALAVMAGALCFILVTNQALHGDPFRSGYTNAWQGSAGGVLNRLTYFSIVDFLRGGRSFLFEIGKAQTALLIIGVAGLVKRRLLRPGDLVLLVLTGCLLYLHLGSAGTHGGFAPFLATSPPRYLQPVYAAGVVLGIESCYFYLRRWSSASPFPIASWAMVTVAILVASIGLHEAYANPQGVPSAERSVSRLRSVYEFSKHHPDAVFVGDINTKGVIDGHTIIPRLLSDPARIGVYVADELRGGHRVFAVDDIRQLLGHPLYSGYYATLQAQGYRFSLAQADPAIVELHPPSAQVGGLLSDGTVDEASWTLSPSSKDAFSPEPDGLHVHVTPSTGYGATLRTACTIQGDFDARLTFRLLAWPANDSLRVGLAQVTPEGQKVIVGRLVDPPLVDRQGDAYFTDAFGSVQTQPTADRAGTVRLARLGTVTRAYVQTAAGWSLISEHSIAVQESTISVGVWGQPTEQAEVVLTAVSVTGDISRCLIPPLTAFSTDGV